MADLPDLERRAVSEFKRPKNDRATRVFLSRTLQVALDQTNRPFLAVVNSGDAVRFKLGESALCRFEWGALYSLPAHCVHFRTSRYNWYDFPYDAC